MTRASELPGFDAVKPIDPQEFEQIRQLAYRTFGLDLRSGKEVLVSARLRPLVRNGGFHSFQEYYRHVLGDPTGAALHAMVDALATNHTAFLREPDHFEFLRSQVAPMLAARPSVDVWCAACSTGEEAWTVAFILSETLRSSRFHITATDISHKALAFAASATYPAERCRHLPAAWLSRYFVETGHAPTAYQVCAEIRSQVAFRRINLVEPIARRRQFPVIFCRNVMIYFDRPTQERVVSQLIQCLEPGGYLLVGHAEGLSRAGHGLEYVGPAIYRKPGKTEDRWGGSA